jgi:PadR family transcriptional regulator, regulatory protein PadR
MTSRRITQQTEQILVQLAPDPSAELSGADIERATGIKKGTVYPALARMTGFGWLAWRWEEVDPKVVGRPRKRLYRITGKGEIAFREIDGQAADRDRRREARRARLKPAADGPVI